jgi:hypothetical protein
MKRHDRRAAQAKAKHARKARKVGRRTIIMTDDLDAWLKALPTKGGRHG